MARAKTYSEFVNEVKELVSDEYTVISKEYINNHTKIKFRHEICGQEFSTTPLVFLSGCRCPNCFGNKRKTNEQFVSELRQINENIIPLDEYQSSTKKILCRCKICNYEWKTTPKSLLHGRGCPSCSHRLKLTQEEFVSRVKKLHPDIEVVGKFATSTDRVDVLCHACGKEWSAVATNLLQGHGCPVCNQSRRKTHKDFIKEAKEKHPYITVLSKYEGHNKKVKLRCDICGYVWDCLPGRIVQKHFDNVPNNCPKCSGKLKKTNEEFLKIISDSSPDIITLTEYDGFGKWVDCKCNKCGYPLRRKAQNLINGVSCPKCSPPNRSTPKSERDIHNFLINNHIDFVIHKTFDDLLGLGNKKLSYDFYLPNYNLLIEANGLQHEKPIDYFGGVEKFKKQQEHDRLKREYAKLHGYELMEIWYYDFDKINQILSDKLKHQMQCLIMLKT